LTGKRRTNVVAFHKKGNMNIGIVLFGAIFIYLVVTVLLYLTNSHISVYEVREGSILKDNAYTGFVVRSEEIITAPADGYVNYFASEGSKVGAKTDVYSISPDELNFTETKGDETGELSDEEREALLLRTQNFTENFNSEQFDDVYLLQDNIEAVLESKTAQSRQAQLAEMLAESPEDLAVYRASTPGIVIYSTDGYEETTISDVTEDMVAKRDYEPVNFQNNTRVKTGDPIYKVITDDTWTLVILLDDETAQDMTETERVKVQFSKDHETTVADFSIYNTPAANLGFLTFDSSMVRYAKERYLDIELILEDESGLKIPSSSVVKKDFYVIPESYLTQGGDSRKTGVLVMATEEMDVESYFKEATVYYRDIDTGMVYLDTDIFEGNEVLIKADSSETLRLKEKETLRGVYNINKGYAVFQEIETYILCESEEYYIVESGGDYGLSNYDHIALNGKDVQEDDIVL